VAARFKHAQQGSSDSAAATAATEQAAGNDGTSSGAAAHSIGSASLHKLHEQVDDMAAK
jgi:hypothetical protein